MEPEVHEARCELAEPGPSLVGSCDSLPTGDAMSGMSLSSADFQTPLGLGFNKPKA